MRYAPERHHRRSIRLKGYDYTQAGAYFVTIVTQGRACLFGEVVEDEMRVNDAGKMVHDVWNDLPNHNPHVELDAFVVMPNHVHGVVLIVDNPVGAGSEPAPTVVTTRRHGLPEIVRQFKTFSARRINALRSTPGAPIWQRSYYEHIIRNEASLNRIREYILTNPLRWHLDRENVLATGTDPADTEWFG